MMTIAVMEKRMNNNIDSKKLQGLCTECSHRYHCENAKRYLNMIKCSQFKQRKHRVYDDKGK